MKEAVTVTEVARTTPVIAQADVCVVGGSCTGVFAAVRAARMGQRVLLIENGGMLGGTATAGMVNIWHSLYDTAHKERIIAGLTQEVSEELYERGDAEYSENDAIAIRFNSTVLSVTLDRMCSDAGITVLLHTRYVSALHTGHHVDTVIVENADGRGAVCADFFIDCTGDALLARDLGLSRYRHALPQPATSCFLMQEPEVTYDINKLLCSHGEEFDLPSDDWGWCGSVPKLRNIGFRADHHLNGIDTSTADGLSRAETLGRLKNDALVRLLRKYVSSGFAPIAFCSHVGIRDGWHLRTRFRATEKALLHGTDYPDTVMRGTYRIDVHHANDGGITFKYLDGRVEMCPARGCAPVLTNWRQDEGLTGDAATSYNIPFGILVQETYDNYIAAGRMLDSDEGAFGALRVMVNLNQLGEAAGVAAALCLRNGSDIRNLDGVSVRLALREGGSAL